MAGITVAALGVVVLVVALFALRNPKHPGAVAGTATGKPSTPHSSTAASSHAPSTASSTASASPTAGPTRLPLVVLNNTTVTGLAEQAAQRFTAGGWTVTSYANYQNSILSTCAYYDPSVPGAQQAAQALQTQFPTIKRVLPQFTGLGAYHSPIVVILTPDYSPN